MNDLYPNPAVYTRLQAQAILDRIIELKSELEIKAI